METYTANRERRRRPRSRPRLATGQISLRRVVLGAGLFCITIGIFIAPYYRELRVDRRFAAAYGESATVLWRAPLEEPSAYDHDPAIHRRISLLRVSRRALSAENITALGVCRSLEHVHFQQCWLAGEEKRALAHFQASSLHLDKCRLAAGGSEVFAALHVSRFNAAQTQLRRDDLRALAKNRTIESLNVGACPVDDECLSWICGMRQLEELVLINTSITSAGIAHLPRLKRLRYLDLRNADMRSADLATIARCTRLRTLMLCCLPIDHQHDLLKLERLTSLRHLTLAHSNVTDEGLAYLSRHPTLQTVGLAKTQVSHPALREFEAAQPGRRAAR